METPLDTSSDAEVLACILSQRSEGAGALLPVLHAIQSAFGFIPPAAIVNVAEALNLSRAEVHGVVTFYRDFRTEPSDRPILKLCRAEACLSRGADALAPLAEADPRVAVETVYCLGLCASGPAAMVGDRVFGRLDAAALTRVLDGAVA